MILDDLLLMFCSTTVVMIQVNGEKELCCQDAICNIMKNRDYRNILKRLVVPNGVVVMDNSGQLGVSIEII